MHLKKITLNNFRCFEKFEMELHPRLTVIVAENGGGKTSVLDGIAVGLSPILRYLSSANQRLSGPGIKDTDYYLIQAESRGDEKWIASDYAQVIVETDSGLKWDQSATSSKGKGKQPQEKIGQVQLAAYLSEVIDSIKTRHQKLMPIFAHYGAKRGWIDVPGRIRDSKVNYDYPTSALNGALDSLTNFKEMLKWFDLEETSELRANKGNTEDFEESPALSEVRAAIEKILGGKYSNPGFDRRHKFVIQADTAPSVLQISQLSQGYQSMLALGMDFARRLALANQQLFLFEEAAVWSNAHEYVLRWNTDDLSNSAYAGPAWAPAIMLVDEIDLHLHPSWQQRVLDDLMRAFPCTQFIVTTHSPQVLSTVKRESIRILVHNDDDSWCARIPHEETKGVESSAAMNDVMGVNQIPPVPEAVWRNDYTAFIENGAHDSPASKELRAKLEAHYGSQHSIILDFDRLIRFQVFKRRKSNSSNQG